MTGRFLPGVPGPDIEAIFEAAPGNEIGTGKFDSPESSAALAANAFGFFLNRASDLPARRVARANPGRLVRSASKPKFASRGAAGAIPFSIVWSRRHRR